MKIYYIFVLIILIEMKYKQDSRHTKRRKKERLEDLTKSQERDLNKFFLKTILERSTSENINEEHGNQNVNEELENENANKEIENENVGEELENEDLGEELEKENVNKDFNEVNYDSEIQNQIDRPLKDILVEKWPYTSCKRKRL